ncbi:hypothetical protein F5Y12DRAFT_770641 [Xylaria sp. FL1777]|nr:hypothetical protein F5Y12DRAFT_770641 [Xylaria sp. FL1777]
MKFLAIPTLLAATVQALAIGFTNDIPVDGNYTIGTDFVLEWIAYDASPTDTFQLLLSAWNNTVSGYIPGPFGSQIPVHDSKEIVLADAVKFSDGSYSWKIEPIDDSGVWEGFGFYYCFTAHFPYTYESPRPFHIVE